MGSDDQSQNIIVKGKRTKRQRSSSPFGMGTMTDSSSSGSADGHRTVRGGDGDLTGVIIDDYNSISSPTTSGEIYESTEEEEDMANCLIMLAQGEGPRKIQERNIIIGEKIAKLSSSRKFSRGMVSAGTNKAGFYVYECKTCNRSFPSFQALGGHRASHKKPKPAIEEKKSSSVAVLPLKEDYYSEEAGQQFNKTNSPPPPTHLSVQTLVNKGNKIHECSICGSEFTSGQALGGHMRRHRAAAAAATGNIQAAAATINISSTIGDQVKPEATRSILALDLNLPAPEDHDNHNHHHHHLRDSKFQFGSTQQALVFSAPALVDCHY